MLQPSLINRLSLDASWKWIYFNARYTHTKDVMVQTSAAYSEDDPTITLLIHDNKYDLDNFNATLSFSPTIGIWSPRLTLMYLQQWYKVDMPNGTQKSFNNPIGSFMWNNNFRLPLGFTLDADFFLQTVGEQENYHIANTVWSADLGLSKAFFNERFSLQLQATNLFNSKEYDAFVYSGNRILGFDQQSRRRFTLTLRYKFNAVKSKYKGTGAGQEQRSRM